MPSNERFGCIYVYYIGTLGWIYLTSSNGIALSQVCEAYFPRDCQDIQAYKFSESDLYNVTPVGAFEAIKVYCDMITDGGGWLVFQRRKDGSVDFKKSWSDYEEGFGDPALEFWLGNLPLHKLTQQGFYELRVDLEDWDGRSRFAKYRYFRVGSPTELYRLYVTGYYGDAGDSFSYHSGSYFSTVDKDNDNHEKNCSADFGGGGWWFNGCHYSNLNGLYNSRNSTSHADGVLWEGWMGWYQSLKSSEMKIRRS